MFYVVLEKAKLLFHQEQVANSMPIDDDFENRFLYVYDEDRHKIVKKTSIPYIVEEIDGNAAIVFESDVDLYLKVIYQRGQYEVSNVGFAYAIDGIAKLDLNIEVTGILKIESIMEQYTITPVMIECTNLIDDDPEPSIRLVDNTVFVEPHFYYKQIQSLKEEIKKLKGE